MAKPAWNPPLSPLEEVPHAPPTFGSLLRSSFGQIDVLRRLAVFVIAVVMAFTAEGWPLRLLGLAGVVLAGPQLHLRQTWRDWKARGAHAIEFASTAQRLHRARQRLWQMQQLRRDYDARWQGFIGNTRAASLNAAHVGRLLDDPLAVAEVDALIGTTDASYDDVPPINDFGHSVVPNFERVSALEPEARDAIIRRDEELKQIDQPRNRREYAKALQTKNAAVVVYDRREAKLQELINALEISQR